MALGIDAERLPFVAAADEQRVVARREHRPEERRGRLVHELRGRTEDQLTVDVDRKILDIALEKCSLRVSLKEFRCRCVERGQRQRGDGQEYENWMIE